MKLFQLETPASTPSTVQKLRRVARRLRRQNEGGREWDYKIPIFMIPVEIQGRGVCGRWNPLALSCKFVLGSVFYPGKGECLNSDKLIVWAP